MAVVSIEKTLQLLERVLYIHYLLHFQKDISGIKVMIDLNSELNARTLMYISKLGLNVYHINVKAQIIDSSTFETFEMVLASF